jgi:tetratricopeptide (TPR) repeat protein
MISGSVGIPSWVFPHVAIIDQFGLNDYVVARHKVPPGTFRLMAHDRHAPENYSYTFAINYGRLVNRSHGFTQRDFELTAEEIVANEQYWIDKIVGGHDQPLPYLAICRIGETYNRVRRLDTAAIWLSQAVAMDSTHPRGFIGLAKALTGVFQFDSAIVLLERADRLDPENPLVQSRLGQNYAEHGYDLFRTNQEIAMESFATAETYLLTALALDDNATDAMVQLASLNLFLDRIDSSGVFLARLEASHEPSPLALDLLGRRYEFKDYDDLAVRAYNLAIKNGLNEMVAEEHRERFPHLVRP